MDDVLVDIVRVADEVVKTTLADVSNGEVATKGRVSDPAEEIAREANQSDVRFVVAGGRKRSSPGKALVGSMTQSVLLHVDQPVVTVIDHEQRDGDTLGNSLRLRFARSRQGRISVE